MKISILMPIYNCPPDLLEKALISVFRQNHTDWEIVIKDGNPSRPAIYNRIIHSLTCAYQDRIKYYAAPEPADRENRQNSYYEALNWCIENSTGEILTVLAGDDQRGPRDTLSFVNQVFEEHEPGPFCLYGDCEWIDRDGSPICLKQPREIPVTFDTILTDFPFYTPSVFWNRAVHEKFGLYDSKNYPWCADLDFWLKTWRGIDSVYAGRVIGQYRQWEVSQQRDNGDLAGKEGSAILEKWRALR